MEKTLVLPTLKPTWRIMIVAFVNQKGGVGKTTLALHVAGVWAARRRRVVIIDADPHGSALDWSAQREREGLPRLFSVLGLARDTLHIEVPEIARNVNHVVIDASSRSTALMRSAEPWSFTVASAPQSHLYQNARDDVAA